MDDVLGQLVRAMNSAREQKERDDKFREYLELCKRRRDEGVGQSVTIGRGDAALVREFERNPYGKRAIEHWNSLPLIQFTHGEQVMDLWPEPPTALKKGDSKDWESYCADAMSNLLWDDFIFYWVELASGARNWARIQPAEAYLETKDSDPIRATFKTDPALECALINQISLFKGRYFFASFFKHFPGEQNVQAAQGLIDRKHPNLMGHAPGNVPGLESAALNNVYIANLYAYLSQSDERAVEVKNAAPRAPFGSKTAKKKPWLRDDIPYIVLLDPTKAAKYGWKARSDEPSDRKSPYPHARRGHRRLLKEIPGIREARSIWVRPAWIGPTGWEHKGRIYKVVQDRKVDYEAQNGDENSEQSV